MESGNELSLRKRIELLWQSSESYRSGFALGFLAVSLTLVLILTDQKSEKLSFKAQPRQKGSMEETNLSSGPQAEALGVSTPSATPEQVIVAVKKKSIPSKPAPLTSVQTKKININTASATLLESLPYIGPVMAGRIVEYRANHGPFKSVDALDNVKGIGPKTIEKFRSLVSVD